MKPPGCGERWRTPRNLLGWLGHTAAPVCGSDGRVQLRDAVGGARAREERAGPGDPAQAAAGSPGLGAAGGADGAERSGGRRSRRGLVKGSATCLREPFYTSFPGVWQPPPTSVRPLRRRSGTRAPQPPASMSGVKKQKTVGSEPPARLSIPSAPLPHRSPSSGDLKFQSPREEARVPGRGAPEEEEGACRGSWKARLGARFPGQPHSAPENPRQLWWRRDLPGLRSGR